MDLGKSMFPNFNVDAAIPNPPNPKQKFGVKKVPLGLNPPSAAIYQALGQWDGSIKYGPYNWRVTKVEAMTYIHACKRHLDAWVDGEELSEHETYTGPDGVTHELGEKPHLGHAMACLAIVIDALETGNLIDDRPPPGRASTLLKGWSKS